MSESIQTGGVGKNPAIEKINRLNALATRVEAAAELEKRAFTAQTEYFLEEKKRRERILKEFSISFCPKGQKRKE